MKIIFLSNYFNDHQRELCNSLYEIAESFIFIETSKPSNDRVLFDIIGKKPEYVKNINDIDINQIEGCDVLIAGHIDFNLIKERIRKDNLTFLYQERADKSFFDCIKFPYRFFKYKAMYGKANNLYLLSAGYYTSYDYKKYFLFKNRSLKFGYFPNKSLKTINFKDKQNAFCWCGRFLRWKKPQIYSWLSKKINKKDLVFNIAGNGVLEKKLSKNNNLVLKGALENDQALALMTQSKYYLFSSGRKEGWGAVLNEAMSAGMVCFCSIKAGSTLYLVKDGVNGFVYKNRLELKRKIDHAISNQELCRNVSLNAKNTINNLWNGKVAAQRFIDFINSGCNVNLFIDGPMSKA